jgi:hypothetical protein
MKRIAADKWKHFFAGIVLGILLQAFAIFVLPGNRLLGATIVFIIVVVISYGFELFSKITGKGHHDVMDAVASIVGGLLGMILFTLLEMASM